MPTHSKLDSFYWIGDIKYYWRVHCQKMQERWLRPVTYARFWDRLKRWWVLKKAIDTPNCKPYVIQTSINSKRNWLRQMTIELISDVDTFKSLDDLIMINRIKMPKPKPTLWQRIKMWFLRIWEK